MILELFLNLSSEFHGNPVLLFIVLDNEDSGYMNGACAHGLGLFREAVSLYDHVLQQNAGHFVYYLREVALFQHQHLDVAMNLLNLDNMMDDCELIFYRDRNVKMQYYV